MKIWLGTEFDTKRIVIHDSKNHLPFFQQNMLLKTPCLKVATLLTVVALHVSSVSSYKNGDDTPLCYISKIFQLIWRLFYNQIFNT